MRHCLYLALLFLGIFVANVSVYAQEPPTISPPAATTTTTTTMTKSTPEGSTMTTEKVVTINTPVPAAKEVVAIPKGYLKCTTKEARWHKGAWVSAYQVCQYKKYKQWIEGHWTCTKHNQGACERWNWQKGHWSRK